MELIFDFFDHGTDCFFIRDVGRRRESLAAVGANVFDGLRKLVQTAGCRSDAHSIGRQCDRKGAA